MDDLSICKRIAEIEGVEYSISRSMDSKFKVVLPPLGELEYNPLTGGSLLQGLIKKHGVHAWLNFYGYWCAECITDYDSDDNPIVKLPSVQKDYEWAACMAIIEANKESDNDL